MKKSRLVTLASFFVCTFLIVKLFSLVTNDEPKFLQYLDARAEAIDELEVFSEADKFWAATEPYMNMLSYAEGTHPDHPAMIRAGSPDPYLVVNGYSLAENYSDHPKRDIPIIRDGKIIDWSDAAGTWQFISTTVMRLRDKHPQWCEGEEYWSPCNQDQAMLYNHSDTGASKALTNGVRVDGNHISVSYTAWKKAIYADSIEWASLPGHNIGAATGQHTHDHIQLWTRYQWYLWAKLGYRRNIQHPIPGYKDALTSPVGWRESTQSYHKGQDFACPAGTPILAPENGTVTDSGDEPAGGHYIVFTPDEFPEFELVARHLKPRDKLPAGTKVMRGDIMAFSSNTGYSDDYHCHLETLVDGGFIDAQYYLKMADWF